ncbi:unannotated protein [freshwater metagenome]
MYRGRYDAEMSSYDRLSSLDASFLHLESLETPMHVGAVSTFEGESFFDSTGRFQLAAARKLVASRLHLIPRFRKILKSVPLHQGRPIWVDDPRFDIAYHVRLTALPSPGTREQLMTLTARVQSQLLDRSRPLWELWFVEGLEEGRVALIQKTHHALVDGVSGVDVATVLLDFQPEPAFRPPPRWIVEPPPAELRLLADSVWERATEPAEIVRSLRAGLRGPSNALENTTRIARSVSSLFGTDALAPHTSLNALVGRNRLFDGVTISFDDVHRVRQAFGGTINDVILAGVSGGLRDLLEARGEPIDGMTLKAFCPVSVRDDAERMQLGNRVSAMFVPLPVGLPDPVERLEAVRDATFDLKEREQAVGASFLLDLTHYAAPTLLGLGARLAHRQPFFNLVVTNVPGPQVPLYCMGGRMLEAFPVVPLTKNLSIGIAILSYCGNLHIGLFVDRDTFPDLPVLSSALENSFGELLKRAEEQLGEPGR